MEGIIKLFGFPFEQIAALLRNLSLSGTIGNVIAIFVYVILSLIPSICFIVLWKKQKNCKWDLLLPVMSILIFAVLYLLINPGLIDMMVPQGKGAVLGGTVQSVFWGYLVLRFVNSFSGEDEKKAHKGFLIIMCAFLAVFVGDILLELVYNLPEAIISLREGNKTTDLFGTEYAKDLVLTYIFFGIQSMIEVLQDILYIIIVSIGIRLIKVISVDKYSPQVVVLAKKLVEKCKTFLIISVLCQMGFNILQMIFCQGLYSISTSITVPVFSVFFLLLVWFLARYIQENQNLKQDNDMFI